MFLKIKIFLRDFKTLNLKLERFLLNFARYIARK